tara:strand:- start:283 stop:1893 length:1611 start_codon:yes stop_codon:yes gene_type:complete
MAQKAKPGDSTLLELASNLAGLDYTTSEDLPKLSDSEIFSEFVLPVVTGASAETEDYKPGFLDAALAIPLAGGAIKAGVKGGKSALNKLIKSFKKTDPEATQSPEFIQTLNRLREERMGPLRPLGLSNPSLFTRIKNFRRIKAQDAIEAEHEQNLRDIASESLGLIERDQRFLNLLQSQGLGDTQVARRASERLRQSAEVFSRPEYENFLSRLNPLSIDDIRNVTPPPATAIGQPMPAAATSTATATTSLPTSTKSIKKTIHGEQASLRFDKSNNFFRARKTPDHKVFEFKGEKGRTYEIKAETISPGSSSYRISIGSEKSSDFASMGFISHRTKVSGTDDFVTEISAITFGVSGPNPRKSVLYAGNIMKLFMEKIPNNTVIREGSLSWDSLVLVIRSAIKQKARIFFHEGTRVESRVSNMSKFSQMYMAAKNKKGQEKVADDFVNYILSKLERSKHLVEGEHGFKVKQLKHPIHRSEARSGKIRHKLTYNAVSIHKMAGALALGLGFKNTKEFYKFLDYDPESVEAQVFDNEIQF